MAGPVKNSKALFGNEDQMMEKRRVKVVKSPEAAGLLNAATLGIWGMIQCWRHLQETAQELKEIEAEEQRQRDLALGKKKA